MTSPLLPSGIQRVLVTGGAGFIGGAMVRRLLASSSTTVFNLDKCGYASDFTGVLDFDPVDPGFEKFNRPEEVEKKRVRVCVPQA